jgi:tRNA 2-thiouridine synthesizing protein A
LADEADLRISPPQPKKLVSARQHTVAIAEWKSTSSLPPPGTVITLLSTDPAAEPDVAAWCRMRGQQLLTQSWQDSPTVLASRIRVSAP